MQGAIAFIKRAHRTRNGIDGPLQMGTGRPHVEQLRRHPRLAPARDLDPVRLDALTRLPLGLPGPRRGRGRSGGAFPLDRAGLRHRGHARLVREHRHPLRPQRDPARVHLHDLGHGKLELPLKLLQL